MRKDEGEGMRDERGACRGKGLSDLAQRPEDKGWSSLWAIMTNYLEKRLPLNLFPDLVCVFTNTYAQSSLLHPSSLIPSHLSRLAIAVSPATMESSSTATLVTANNVL
jgi:hypothetical protein